MKNSIRLLVILAIFFAYYCKGAVSSTSVQQYYTSQPFLQNSIKVIASDLDQVLVKRKGILFRVSPIKSTITLYKQLGIPVVVWTNNHRDSYESKIKKINLTPRGSFVVKKNCKVSMLYAPYSKWGKPHPLYYTKAYDYTKHLLKLSDNDVVVFVDDKAENVNAARNVAKKYSLPIIAIQYTTPAQLRSDFNWLMRVQAKVPAAALSF